MSGAGAGSVPRRQSAEGTSCLGSVVRLWPRLVLAHAVGLDDPKTSTGISRLKLPDELTKQHEDRIAGMGRRRSQDDDSGRLRRIETKRVREVQIERHDRAPLAGTRPEEVVIGPPGHPCWTTIETS